MYEAHIPKDYEKNSEKFGGYLAKIRENLTSESNKLIQSIARVLDYEGVQNVRELSERAHRYGDRHMLTEPISFKNLDHSLNAHIFRMTRIVRKSIENNNADDIGYELSLLLTSTLSLGQVGDYQKYHVYEKTYEEYIERLFDKNNEDNFYATLFYFCYQNDISNKDYLSICSKFRLYIEKKLVPAIKQEHMKINFDRKWIKEKLQKTKQIATNYKRSITYLYN